MERENLFSPEREKPRYPYIGVMGPPGVGKSTLVKIFEKDPNFCVFEEMVEQNPYVGDSYLAPDGRKAFYSQVRFRELKICQRAATKITWKEKIPFQDTPNRQDGMYALVAYEEGRMSSEDYEKYQNHTPQLESILPIPDLVIWLKVSPEVLDTRIINRGRGWEKAFTPYFRKRMIGLCQKEAEEYPGHVLILDTDRIDYAHTEEGLDEAARRIKRELVRLWGDNQGVGIDGSRIILPSSLIEEVKSWGRLKDEDS